MDEDAQPFRRQDGGQILAVEGVQLVGHGHRGVVEQGLPARVPAALDGLLVDALDEQALGRKVVVQQRVRDAQLGGQFAHLRVQAAAGEEVDGTVDDLLLALRRLQPPALLRRRGSGR